MAPYPNESRRLRGREPSTVSVEPLNARITSPSSLGAYCTALAFVVVLSVAPWRAAADGAQAIEEVVVTGSHLKREARDFASPLTILEKDRLDAVGATDIKEIVRSLSFNAGSLGVSATNWAGDDSSTGNASVNLRNLGSGATLVLINGKRTVNTTYDNSGSGYVDVQGLVPNIALERIEVVKDGASALYGSDAVAGVVNFITRRGFDGVELQVDFSSDDETHEQQDLLLSGLAGTTGDWGPSAWQRATWIEAA